MLGVVQLANEGVQTGECFIAENIQIVALGFIAEQHAAVLESCGFLAEGCGCVLQLSLQLQDVFAHLGEQSRLQQHLTLPAALATRCFYTGLV